MQQRLQKVMADAGVAGRRTCEQMILDGLVRVNGHVVRKLPVLVDPEHDFILVDGKKLRPPLKVYYLLNKPKNVVCSNAEDDTKRRAIDLIGPTKFRLYTVGRLDIDNKGLILLTNDGELTNRLTHPRYGIEKTYVADITPAFRDSDAATLMKGFWLSDGRVSMEKVVETHRTHQGSTIEVILREGRNRQIRRMLAHLGYKVKHLTRTRIGPLAIEGLKTGMYRALLPAEVKKLYQLTEHPETAPGAIRKRRTSPRKSGRNVVRKRKTLGPQR